MRLSLAQAVGYLGISEGTARRWIRERGLPVHRASERLFVNPVELWEWAIENRVAVSPQLLEDARRSPESVPPLSRLLEAGGIHCDVPGDTPLAVLRAVVDRLPLPATVDREFLVEALAGREAMGSTGIGHGIAIPHVRNPILLQVDEPIASLCLLARPVDFGAMDGELIHTVFTLVSPTVPAHLRMLAMIGYLLQHAELQEALERRAPAPELLETIRRLERESARSRQPEPGVEA